MTVKEANLAYRQMKSKYEEIYLENTSNKRAMAALTKQLVDVNKMHASQLNKNINVVKNHEGLKEKYKLSQAENTRLQKEITSLHKDLADSNAKQYKIEFMKKEYDSLKSKYDAAESRATSTYNTLLKHVTDVSKEDVSSSKRMSLLHAQSKMKEQRNYAVKTSILDSMTNAHYKRHKLNKHSSSTINTVSTKPSYAASQPRQFKDNHFVMPTRNTTNNVPGSVEIMGTSTKMSDELFSDMDSIASSIQYSKINRVHNLNENDNIMPPSHDNFNSQHHYKQQNFAFSAFLEEEGLTNESLSYLFNNED